MLFLRINMKTYLNTDVDPKEFRFYYFTINFFRVDESIEMAKGFKENALCQQHASFSLRYY